MLNYALITISMLSVAMFGAPMMLKWFADSWDSTAVCLCCRNLGGKRNSACILCFSCFGGRGYFQTKVVDSKSVLEDQN